MKIDKGKKICYCIFLFVISLMVRLAHYYTYPDLTRDSCKYINDIRDGLSSINETINYPLLFSRIAECGEYFGGNFVSFGLSLNIVIGALIPLLGMWLSQIITGNTTTSMISGLLIATHPALVSLSGQFQRETLYIFFVILGIYYYIFGIKKKRLSTCISAGILLSIAFHIRFEAIEFCIVAIINSFFSRFVGQKEKRIATCHIALIIIFLFICIVFYSLGLDSMMLRKIESRLFYVKRLFNSY